MKSTLKLTGPHPPFKFIADLVWWFSIRRSLCGGVVVLHSSDGMPVPTEERLSLFGPFHLH